MREAPAYRGPAQQHDGHAAEGAAPADQPMGPADSVGEEDGGAAFWEDSAHPMDDDGRQQADAAAPAEPPPWLEGDAQPVLPYLQLFLLLAKS